MISMYQRYYPFRGLMFSTSSALINLCKELSIDVVTSFKINAYGLPYLKNMIRDSQSHFSSLYYGYINSDILFTEHLFSILTLLQEQVKNATLAPSVCV